MSIKPNVTVGGSFTLTRKIGKGSFGVIYEGKFCGEKLAKGKYPGEVYAVKFVSLIKICRNR